MHVLAQLLQALLVHDAEVLLLVDDQQAQPLEGDRLAEQRVRADHDVDGAFLDAGLDGGELLGRHQARGLGDAHRQALEAFGEGGEVLAGEQRGRHHHRHLEARQGRGEGGPQRHLGLAEADVAAHQPVHRLAGCQVLHDRGDAGRLVLGLAIGEAGHELVELAGRRGDGGRLAQLSQRRNLDQLGGNGADALLEAGLARLPGDAAEAVELHDAVGRAVARQELDVFHGQIELGALGVGDLQAVVRRAQRRDGGEPVEAADAMVGVHYEVADAEAGRLGDDVGGAAGLAAGAHQPVAQDVLLADDGEVGGLEALLEARARRRPPCQPAAPPPR